MAITNYSTLKQSVVNWSHQDDIDTLVDDLIVLAEDFMYSNDIEQLAAPELETVSSGTSISSKTEALPTGFLKPREIRLLVSDGDGRLEYEVPDAMIDRTGTGRPCRYTIKGTNIVFDVSPDQTYNIEYTYYAKPTGISSSNTTNTVLTNYPRLYLFGCLWALGVFNDDLEMQAKYQNLFIAAVRGANKRGKNYRTGATPKGRLRSPVA